MLLRILDFRLLLPENQKMIKKGQRSVLSYETNRNIFCSEKPICCGNMLPFVYITLCINILCYPSHSLLVALVSCHKHV